MAVRSDVDVKDIHLLSVVNFVMDLFLFCALWMNLREMIINWFCL